MIIVLIKTKPFPNFSIMLLFNFFPRLAGRKKPRKLFKWPWYEEFLKMQSSFSYKDTFLLRYRADHALLRYRADHAYHFSYSYLKPAV